MFSLHSKLVSSLFLPLCLSLSAYNNVWQCSSVGKCFRQKFEYISNLLLKLPIMWPFGNYVPTHFHSCRRKTALYMCNYKCDLQHHRHILLRSDTDCCCMEARLQRAQTSLTPLLSIFMNKMRSSYKATYNGCRFAL